jgi:hypothetical protein
MSRERVGIEDVSDLCRQSVKPVSHADRLAGQIDLGPWGKLDHVVAFSADSTRCSACSLTKASTRNRVPSNRSISIKLGRRSGNPPAERAVGDARAITDGAASTRSAGPPSSPRANTPIGTKLVFSAAGLAAGSGLAATAMLLLDMVQAAGTVLRQLKIRLAFTPCRRATSVTDAPAQKASATIRCFSVSGHDRRARRTGGFTYEGTVCSAELNVPGSRPRTAIMSTNANGH